MYNMQLKSKYLKKTFKAFWSKREDKPTRVGLKHLISDIRDLSGDTPRRLKKAPRRPNFRLIF